ncbi:8454_t:CDS:2 [Paraglomus brasilianum]|uniref:8454_t:CDS:1 n=1 Tax=Paraglomus brasilianum TaxID=144538 RepID=A0A9N9FKW5_9GLOM|nr:8454_t:CDS:2 [Paraglomus brasilianum]
MDAASELVRANKKLDRLEVLRDGAEERYTGEREKLEQQETPIESMLMSLKRNIEEVNQDVKRLKVQPSGALLAFFGTLTKREKGEAVIQKMKFPFQL